MAQIIVKADSGHDHDLDSVMLRERVNISDFESERFASNLVERLGWAVIDAAEAERDGTGAERPAPVRAERRSPAREPVHA